VREEREREKQQREVFFSNINVQQNMFSFIHSCSSKTSSDAPLVNIAKLSCDAEVSEVVGVERLAVDHTPVCVS
jgi:hypothetical protein